LSTTWRDAVSDPLVLAAAAIRNADALLIGAGAGMGVDSGLPDFRGNDGFWNAYPPFRKQGLTFVDLAQPCWYRSDPAQAWGFYGHRRNLYRATQPHSGFAILRRWAEERRGYFVFTSNVDNHFQRAGFAADSILECHGTLEHMQCVNRCRGDIWPADDNAIDVDETTFRAKPPLPACIHCGGLARPNVLMFDDYEWQPHRTERQLAKYHAWLEQIAGSRLVAIELGAGKAVPTVRQECQRRATTLIRINLREPEVPSNGIGIPMGALAALQEIDRLLSL
jgi:NAD-dependent SIR2 family protein deacetylase